MSWNPSGYVDNKTEIARFSMDGQVIEKRGGELNNMLIIVRELKGGPPNCKFESQAPIIGRGTRGERNF